MVVGQRIGSFVIEEEIGSGGMGTVYRARHVEKGRIVAVKVVSVGMEKNPKTLARFERETAILKELEHPNIVRFYTAGQLGGKPLYIMEYIEGETLADVLGRRGRLPWEEVVTLGRQVCAGLQHAHDRGVVHRDLKPANIMITRDGTAKITDFGLAKRPYLDQLTATHHTVGTLIYMSPEQCRGTRDLSLRSDLYSLGIVFYELLTGRLPFQADSILDIAKAHMEGTFERPARVVLDIPVWLDTLVCQMLEKDPDKRPLSAAVVAEALDRAMEKALAHRSAGVDAVSAHPVERPRPESKPDHEDLEAARALKSAVTGKRSRRRRRSGKKFVWLQAAVLIAVLLVGAGAVYLATRPPDPDRLFAEAHALMAAKDPDKADKARYGPIEQFLRHYPERHDLKAQQIKDWAREVDVAQRERALANRMKFQISPEGEAEAKAQAAVSREEAGDLAAARERWQSLEMLRDSPEPEAQTWGFLAAKRIQDLDAAGARETQVARTVENMRGRWREFKPEDETEAAAVFAARYQAFGDFARALEQWKKLQEMKPPGRTWLLLTAKKVAELKARAPSGPVANQARSALVREKLEAARQKGDDPQALRLVCEEVVALYQKDPDLADQVKTARELLQKLPRRETR